MRRFINAIGERGPCVRARDESEGGFSFGEIEFGTLNIEEGVARPDRVKIECRLRL